MIIYVGSSGPIIPPGTANAIPAGHTPYIFATCDDGNGSPGVQLLYYVTGSAPQSTTSGGIVWTNIGPASPGTGGGNVGFDPLYSAWLTANCHAGKPPIAQPPMQTTGGQPPVLPPIGPPQPPAGKPCPPCSQPSTVVPKPVSIGCATGSIPNILMVGSREFCAAKGQLQQDFKALGESIITVFANAAGVGILVPSKSTPPSSVIPSISDIIGGLWDTITSWIETDTTDAISKMKDIVKCWWAVVTSAKGCDLETVAYLAVVKGFIDFLQRFRLGWDLAIWGTFDINIVIPPLVKVLDYLIDDACPAEIPAVGETIDGWVKGAIPDDLAMCWLSLRGCNWDVWAPIVYSRRERLLPEEYIQWQRRNHVDEQSTQDGLRAYGFIDPSERIAKLALYDELPTIQDHLHWLQRNVFDDAYVTDYDLLNGFEERFWTKFGSDLRALGMKKEYAALHYAAHWLNPSPGQLAEMLQRLRPGRVDPSVQFTEQDYLRILAEQDVAPYFRERMRQIAYRTLPIRQLTSSVKHGLFDRNELVNRWQDIGFKLSDAEKIADAMMIDAARQEATAGHGLTPSAVAKLSPGGFITRDEAIAALKPQGYTETEVDTLINVAKLERNANEEETRAKQVLAGYAKLASKAYAGGVIDRNAAFIALRSSGYTDDAANLELQTVQLQVSMARANEASKAVRKAFLRGELDATQAANALIAAGFTDIASVDYVSRWRLEMTVPRQHATTGQILKWAKEGTISVANAEQRLLNIGWSKGDVDIQVLELEQSIAQAAAKATANRAKILAEAQAAAKRALKLSQAGFCKLFTPSKMVRWYSERIIDDGKFTYRLQQCGYEQSAIDDLLKEAQVARDAKDLKAAKKGSTGIEYTGQGAVGGGPAP